MRNEKLFPTWSKSEIKKIGQRHITKHDYPEHGHYGYTVSFKGHPSKFFSMRKYNGWRAAYRAAKRYRDDLLITGAVYSSRPTPRNSTPQIEPSEALTRLRFVIAKAEDAGVETLAQFRALTMIAEGQGNDANTIITARSPIKTTTRWLSQQVLRLSDRQAREARKKFGLVMIKEKSVKSATGRRPANAIYLTKKGKRLMKEVEREMNL